MSEPVLLDTAGILAVLNSSDQWHDQARSAFVALTASPSRPFTTSYILAEAANAVARTPIRGQVAALRDELELRQRVVVPTSDDWNSAWAAYRRGESGDAGLVDQLSFMIMRRMGVRRAFTNDKHFRAAGFETLF
jgi:predicted nucleic acid-binding protein